MGASERRSEVAHSDDVGQTDATQALTIDDGK
jgi:hypothetical protein